MDGTLEFTYGLSRYVVKQAKFGLRSYLAPPGHLGVRIRTRGARFPRQRIGAAWWGERGYQGQGKILRSKQAN